MGDFHITFPRKSEQALDAEELGESEELLEISTLLEL